MICKVDRVSTLSMEVNEQADEIQGGGSNDFLFGEAGRTIHAVVQATIASLVVMESILVAGSTAATELQWW